MSTEPLLPSYASATQHDASPHVRRHSARRRTSLIIPAAPVIQTLSGLTFMTTAIISTVWAYRSYAPPPEPSPTEPPSLLPYFASLCLTISLGFWVGYLLFILYDGAGGPRMQRKVVIGASTPEAAKLGTDVYGNTSMVGCSAVRCLFMSESASGTTIHILSSLNGEYVNDVQTVVD
ncbi:hypothetical protein CBS147343_4914 [Aspergillus niger]|nr:hypothetical protein CBS147371_2912 [Aspergillus niger]KAI3073849.1 hypothetical protein CBS147343_4914 [Aspergillus niger]